MSCGGRSRRPRRSGAGARAHRHRRVVPDDWLSNPGDYLSSVLADEHQRESLVTFVDNVLGGADVARRRRHRLAADRRAHRAGLSPVRRARRSAGDYVAIGIGVRIAATDPRRVDQAHVPIFRAAKKGHTIASPLLIGTADAIGRASRRRSRRRVGARPGQAHLGGISSRCRCRRGGGAAPRDLARAPTAADAGRDERAGSHGRRRQRRAIWRTRSSISCSASCARRRPRCRPGRSPRSRGCSVCATASASRRCRSTISRRPASSARSRVARIGAARRGLAHRVGRTARESARRRRRRRPRRVSRSDRRSSRSASPRVDRRRRPHAPHAVARARPCRERGRDRPRRRGSLHDRSRHRRGDRAAALALQLVLGHRADGGTRAARREPADQRPRRDATRRARDRRGAQADVRARRRHASPSARTSTRRSICRRPTRSPTPAGVVLGDVADEILGQLGPAGDAVHMLLGFSAPAGHPEVRRSTSPRSFRIRSPPSPRTGRRSSTITPAAIPSIVTTLRDLIADAADAGGAVTGTRHASRSRGASASPARSICTRGSTAIACRSGRRSRSSSTRSASVHARREPLRVAAVAIDLAARHASFLPEIVAGFTLRARGRTDATFETALFTRHGRQHRASRCDGRRRRASAARSARRISRSTSATVRCPVPIRRSTQRPRRPSAPRTGTRSSDCSARLRRVGRRGSAISSWRSAGASARACRAGGVAGRDGRAPAPADLVADPVHALPAWLASRSARPDLLVRGALADFAARRRRRGRRRRRRDRLGPADRSVARPACAQRRGAAARRLDRTRRSARSARPFAPTPLRGVPAIPASDRQRSPARCARSELADDVAALLDGRPDIAAGLDALVARWAGTDGRVVPPETDPRRHHASHRIAERSAAICRATSTSRISSAARRRRSCASPSRRPTTLPWPDTPADRLVDFTTAGSRAGRASRRRRRRPASGSSRSADAPRAGLRRGDADGIAGQTARLAASARTSLRARPADSSSSPTAAPGHAARRACRGRRGRHRSRSRSARRSARVVRGARRQSRGRHAALAHASAAVRTGDVDGRCGSGVGRGLVSGLSSLLDARTIRRANCSRRRRAPCRAARRTERRTRCSA